MRIDSGKKICSGWRVLLLLCLSIFFVLLIDGTVHAAKPGPAEALNLLKEGNARFVSGAAMHPRSDATRLAQAGRENQGDHAYATVISCSDSRVPVERLFDAGIMDLFVIRVAGNVADTDEIGSIEYGLAHVNTPVLVVLGHTQCGAVTAVTHALNGKGHALERNIPPLVDNIQPAVLRATKMYPDLEGEAIIPQAIVENVWQSVEDLFLNSPATRQLVHSGKTLVVGAIYDVANGRIEWLPENKPLEILAKVEANPLRAMQAMAEEGGGSHSGSGHGGETAVGDAHGKGAGAEETARADREKVDAMVAKVSKMVTIPPSQEKVAQDAGMVGLLRYIGLFIGVAGVAAVLTWWLSRSSNATGRKSVKILVGTKVMASFSGLILLVTGIGIYSLITLGRLGDNVEELAEETIPVLTSVANIDAHQLQQSLQLERVFRYGGEQDDAARKKMEEAFHAYEEFGGKVNQELDRTMGLLDKIPATNSDDAREMGQLLNTLSRLKREHLLFEKLGAETFTLLEAGAAGQAHLLEEYVETAEDKLNEEIKSLLEYLEKRVDSIAHATEEMEKTARFRQTVILLAAVLASFFAALLLTVKITRPIRMAADYARVVASGDISHTLDHSGTDEVGALADALNNMSANLKTMLTDIMASAGALAQASSGLSRTSEEMSDRTGQTSQNANSVAAAAEQMSANMHSVAAATEQASTNISMVASASEEMSSTIAEIAKNTERTNNMMAQAVSQAGVASERVNELGRAALEISKVTETITEISDQTNLLALNATIEAARAGEAGKGFAVVANEIKELAKQTAMATLEIKNKIDGVQNSTDHTVTEIAAITRVINDVNAMTASIAASIVEQTAATQEISNNVAQASRGIQEVTGNVSESSTVAKDIAHQVAEINQAAAVLTSNSSEVQSRSGELADLADTLNTMVRRFTI